ncbi:acetyl-CoA C-acetyltransferase [Candidatus Microgenomates bacterium]|nr:MAG: acetyl-CoA C-acetyltransferase [Candidatus Microgenomates bacterium]
MEEVYIIDAKRTPIGKYGGSLIGISATELGATVIKALVEKNPKTTKYINEVIIGNVLSAGLGQNPARISALKAGLSHNAPCLTINKVCGSGLKSILIGTQSIQTNNAQVIIAGGMENMSRAPYLLDNYRFGTKFGHQTIKDAMIYDGLFCSLVGMHMGKTAEYLAKKYKIQREEQDEFAFSSHQKALSAITQKKFERELVSVKTKNGKASLLFNQDEQPRKDTSLEALEKLPSAFSKNGSITAGNSSTVNDGASAVIIASATFVKKNKIKPMAKIKSYSYIGLNPRFMGLGAYYAIKECLLKSRIRFSDIDLWEINEAFSSQILAVIKLLEIDKQKVNVNGGAIALGHPIGASGARILTTLLYELKKQSKKYGVASLCIGGGQGVAILVENV